MASLKKNPWKINRGELDFFSAVEQIESDIENFSPLAKSKESLPYLLHHGKKTKYSAIVVHGLTDSPGHFKSIAEILFRHGFNVFGARLDGHGTKPEHLLDVTAEQWQNTISKSITLTNALGDNTIYAGFSCGGALLLDAVLRGNQKPSGMILVAPAMNLATKLAPFLKYYRFIQQWRDKNWSFISENDPYCYNKMSLNAAYHLYRICNIVMSHKKKWKMNCPIFMGSSESDLVISQEAVQNFIKHQDSSQSEWFNYPKTDAIVHASIPRRDLNPLFTRLEDALVRFLRKHYNEGHFINLVNN